jgi:hypothetical protein
MIGRMTITILSRVHGYVTTYPHCIYNGVMIIREGFVEAKNTPDYVDP